MHYRRAASFLLGAWLAGSVFAAVTAFDAAGESAEVFKGAPPEVLKALHSPVNIPCA
jgi:hypothetical protein